MRIYHTLILCLYGFLLGFSPYIKSQSHSTYIKKVHTAEGLNLPSVYDLFINKQGLLYLGTERGLASYNGVILKKYKFENNLGWSLNRIQQDSKGTIWCKNFSNQVFYLENDTLKPDYRVEKYLNDSHENLVDFVIINEQFYFLTEQNLYVASIKGDLKPLFNAKEHDVNVFYTLHHSDTQLFLSGDSKILEIQDQEILRSYAAKRGQKELIVTQNELLYVLKGQDNQLISITNDRTFQKNLISSNTYYNSISSTSKALWLNTSKGLYKVDAAYGKIAEQLIPEQRVTDVVEDREGGIWISTLDDGIYYIPSPSMYKLISKSAENHADNYTSIELSKEGHLFAGTSSGSIIEYNTDMVDVFHYSGSSSLEIEYIYLHKDKILSSVGVFNKRQQAPLIDVYFGEGVAIDDFGNFVFNSYNLAGLISQSLVGPPEVAIADTSTIYLSDYLDDLQLYSFRNKRSRAAIYSSVYRSYYIGFSDGLIKIDVDGSRKEIRSKDQQPLIVLDIIEGKNGELWIATEKHGVIKIENERITYQISEEDGLASNSIKKLKIDQKGIWILNQGGFDFFNLITKELVNHSNRLGLTDVSINDFTTNTAYVWFATNEGLIFFDKTILDKKIEPVFTVTATNSDLLPINKDTTLSYLNNHIQFQFNTIYYRGSSNYEYQFKLSPVQDQWQSQNASQTRLNFLSLEPNQYKLFTRIKTGPTFTDVNTFEFNINKPFWSTAWFKLVLVILLMLLLYVVYHWAVIKTKKKQHVSEMLAISQLTALRAQMNPHFIFNVLNAVQGLIYSNQKRKANEYLATFSTLMRKTLDISDKHNITIAQEVDTIEIYLSLEQGRFEENEFKYDIILPEEDLDMYTIPSLIIQPFVENAIKHGLMHKTGNKYLIIEVVRKNKNYWKFTIEDNGIGRKASELINFRVKNKPESFASDAINNRIKLMNKLSDFPIIISIEDLINPINKQSAGTRVNIDVPIVNRFN